MSASLFAHQSVNRDTALAAIEELGNPGWNWETYLRYSKKSERYVIVLRKLGLPADYLRRFTPPDAEEAEAEHLHYDQAHHGIDGERFNAGDSGDPGSG